MPALKLNRLSETSDVHRLGPSRRTAEWQMMVGIHLRLLAGLALAVGLAWMGRVLYILKSHAGVDLIPGVHGPDILPFLG